MTNISASTTRKNKCTWCGEYSTKAFCSSKCKEVFDKSFSCHFCGDPIEQSRKAHPSCRECEQAYDANLNYCCFAGKAAAIAELYNHKYRNSLYLIDWSKEELEEMGKNMRSAIDKSLREKYLIEARLAHLSFKSKVHTCKND